MSEKKSVLHMDIEEFDKELEKKLRTPWLRVVLAMVQSLSLVVLIAVLKWGAEMGLTTEVAGKITDVIVVFNLLMNFLPLLRLSKRSSEKAIDKTHNKEASNIGDEKVINTMKACMRITLLVLQVLSVVAVLLMLLFYNKLNVSWIVIMVTMFAVMIFNCYAAGVQHRLAPPKKDKTGK